MTANKGTRLPHIIALFALLLSLTVAPSLRTGASAAPRSRDPSVQRGRYLVAFGCNDCHTPGWRETDGAIPVRDWMTGSKIGYRGPWGTYYAANVRLEFQEMTEEQWLFMVRTRGGHWPMVWHDLRALTADDQRSIYRFIKSLGPRGVQVPADLPPWKEPRTKYMWVLPSTPNPRATPEAYRRKIRRKLEQTALSTGGPNQRCEHVSAAVLKALSQRLAEARRAR
jgi:hypothetical protein